MAGPLPGKREGGMKLTILYDNTAFREDLQADWGFAALVEAHGRTVLFDTGARGEVLLSNMDRLGAEAAAVTDLFLSHAHFDHAGGLPAFLGRHPEVRLWVPASVRGVPGAREVVRVTAARTLHPGLHSTGQLDGMEQSLCVETAKGVVVVAGCSHPPVRSILEAASAFGPVHGIIGGLHGNPPASVQGLGLVCATHCTQHGPRMREQCPDSWEPGGAGRVLEVPDRVLPGEAGAA